MQTDGVAASLEPRDPPSSPPSAHRVDSFVWNGFGSPEFVSSFRPQKKKKRNKISHSFTLKWHLGSFTNWFYLSSFGQNLALLPSSYFIFIWPIDFQGFHHWGRKRGRILENTSWCLLCQILKYRETVEFIFYHQLWFLQKKKCFLFSGEKQMT